MLYLVLLLLNDVEGWGRHEHKRYEMFFFCADGNMLQAHA